jgi:hypothetical protein
MGDALWGAQLLGAVLGLDDVQSGQVYQRLGGRDSFDEAVRSWNFRIEQKRYNVNQIRADIFIEGNRERYRFISGDQEEFPEVYRALRKIADDILAAAGYDPSHFRFHLSDYREGNAFVIHFANHIVVNLGFLWDTLVPILGDHPSPAQLKDYLQDHLAYVIGHEVGHLRQYRNEINRGDVPKPETVDEMHEKMKKGDMDLMKGKLEQHVEIYAGEVDADNFAVELMDRAGYNVREAHRAFQLLIEARIRRELGLKGSEKAARKIARFKSDHPLLEERVKNIRRTVMSKISRSEYEPVKRFAPGVFDELLAWREDGQYAFRRTRMRDFHRRVLAVTTLEELEEVVGDARDMKELEMASTYGVYALLFHRADPACRGKQGAAFSAFADYQRKMTGQVKRRLAAYKKAAAEIGVKVRDTYFAASAVIEPNYFDARCDLDLSPKISVPGGERAEPETLMALFLRTALSGEHVSLRAVLSGYSEYGLNDEQKEALRKLNEEAERLINEDLKDAVSQTQLNAVLDEIAHEARVSEVLDLVRQKTQSKSAKLTLSLTALPEFVQRYHSLSAVQSFYGANVGVSEDITGLKHREEAEAIRGKFRTLPKGEFAGFLGHLAASTWTPDIDPKDTDAGPPNAFLEEMNPSNGERTHAFFNSSDQLASLYEKVLDERVAEFSTQELLDYLPAFANFRKMLSEKFRGLNRIASEAESRFGMRLLFEIIRRLDEAPQLATSEVLSRLMEFWNNYPELLVLDYPAKEAHIFHARIGNFLLRHFILDGSHYEQFRAELFVLLAKTQGRIPCYFGPVPEGENRAPYVETRRVTEYLMERFENGELEDLPHFSARSQHGNRAEDVFMEWYRLTNAFRNGQYPLEEGVLALESFRLRMAETVMRKFGIRTVAQKLEFYERLLARTEGKEKQPLFFKPALAGFNHELDPLSYFCFEQAGLLLSGSVSFWQIRGLYEEDIYGGRDSYRGRGYRYSDPENSDESGEKRFIRALNVFEEIPGQPQVYRFKAGIREEDLTDERLRGLFRDLQIAARDTTGEDHIHQVLAAAHAQSGLAFDPNSHEEVRRLMYLFHAGGLLSIERFYEIVLNGIDPERTDRWTLRDLRALFVFLNALTPEQNKRSLSAGNEFSPANWPQYLTALSLFLIQEEFGFRLPGEVSFHEGLVNAPQNPYQIFFGDLPYDNSFVWDMKTLLADKALEALFRDYPRTLHDRAITSAQNGRTRSVDRFHMTSLKPEQLSQVFGFMESRPEWGFREWVDYARQYMPATVTRNLFLYYVFWKMKIAPAPAAGRSGDARFYDWTFTANTVSRLAGGDDSLSMIL